MAVLSLDPFEIRSHDVVILASGHAEGKFAVMIGIQIPLTFLVGGATDHNLHAVDRVIVWPPNGAKNESIGIRWSQLLGRGTGAGHRRKLRGYNAEDRQQEEKN